MTLPDVGIRASIPPDAAVAGRVDKTTRKKMLKKYLYMKICFINELSLQGIIVREKAEIN